VPAPRRYWLYEAGIGENRSLLIDGGRTVKLRLERENTGLRAGSVCDIRFAKQYVAGKSGLGVDEQGREVLIQPLPKALTEGMTLRAEIVREAIRERGGQDKRAVARASDEVLCDGPSLLERITAEGLPVITCHPHEADRMEATGWSEILDQAISGHVPFPGGSLRIMPTPAMTVIDVDGTLPPADLAKAAAKAAAAAIVLFDLSGSIVVDFPTLSDKVQRQAVLTAFDETMTVNCERTAINGFGLMQIIVRRERASVCEMVQSGRVMTATLALLRRAERERGTGELALAAHPAVVALLRKRGDWLDALAQRLGRVVKLVPDPGIQI
jgi:hypothetical protein